MKENIGNLSTKAEQLEWRRGKVVELRARGLSYMEIASELQVPKSSVGEDMQYLREQAKQNIKEYTTQHLPEQYQVSLRALDTILKHAYEILQTSHDNREKIQALQLFKDTHLEKLNLLSNATTIENALTYIRSKQQSQQQQAQHKKPLTDDEDNSDSHITAATTGKQSVF